MRDWPGSTAGLSSSAGGIAVVQDADLIVVMHDGALVEKGTHSELMQIGGHYRGLHDIQFARPD